MQTKEVIASLEGMKVRVTSEACELQEYDFVENVWREIEVRSWPLRPEEAEGWLQNWNAVDRVEALNFLTAQQPE